MTRSLSGRNEDRTELRKSRSCADRCCRFVCLDINSSVSMTLMTLPSHTYCCFRPPLLLPTGRTSRPSGVLPDLCAEDVKCYHMLRTCFVLDKRGRRPAYIPHSLICFQYDCCSGLVCSNLRQQTMKQPVCVLWVCHVTVQPVGWTTRTRVPCKTLGPHGRTRYSWCCILVHLYCETTEW